MNKNYKTIGLVSVIIFAGILGFVLNKNATKLDGQSCGYLFAQAESFVKNENVNAYRNIRNSLWNSCKDKEMLSKLDNKVMEYERKLVEVKQPSKLELLETALLETNEAKTAFKLIKLNVGFEDERNDMSTATSILTLWSAVKLTWNDLISLPKTTRAMVLKNSEAERGKLLCSSGRIGQITAQNAAEKLVVYEGGIRSGSGVIRFIAVKSTGKLVEDSHARFCGIVTGRYSYDNVAGGTTHAVRAVGMFDLPENKKL